MRQSEFIEAHLVHVKDPNTATQVLQALPLKDHDPVAGLAHPPGKIAATRTRTHDNDIGLQ
jgi:hypothetical protein